MGEAIERVSVIAGFQTQNIRSSRSQIKQFFGQLYSGSARAERSMFSFGKSQDVVKKKTDSLLSSTKRLVAGFLAYRSLSAFKSIGRTAIEFEKLDFQMKSVFSTQGRIRSEFQFTNDLARRYGLEILNVTSGYAKLSAASKNTNLEGRKTRDIFEGIIGASASLGLSGERLSGTLLAVEQIMSKGVVSSEEIRRQLGDRIPGAFQIASRAMNVTTAELDSMLRSGSLLAEDFLPKFGAQLRKEFPNGAKHVKTLQGRINLFSNAWKKMQAGIVNSGFGEVIGKMFERASIFIENNQSQIKAFAELAVRQIPKLIKFGTILVSIFAAKKIASLAGSIIGSIRSVAKNFRLGAGLIKVGTGLILAGFAAIAAAKADLALTEAAFSQIGIDGYAKSLGKIRDRYSEITAEAKSLTEIEKAFRDRRKQTEKTNKLSLSGARKDPKATKAIKARIETEKSDIDRDEKEAKSSFQLKENKKVIGDINTQTSAIKKQIASLKKKNDIALLGVEEVAKRERAEFFKRNGEALGLGKISVERALQNIRDFKAREKATKELAKQKKIAEEIAKREKERKNFQKNFFAALKKGLEAARKFAIKIRREELEQRKDRIKRRREVVEKRIDSVDSRRDRLKNIKSGPLTSAVQIGSLEGERQRLLSERNKAISPEVKAIEEFRSELVQEIENLKTETSKITKELRDLKG